MHIFCTYFDKNFLPQGISLIRSIEKVYSEQYIIYVLCLDDLTFKIIRSLKLNKVSLVSESEIFNFEPKLKFIKKERLLVHYYYCLAPILINYTLKFSNNAVFSIYIDADVFFFNNFLDSLNKYKDYDILLFEHGKALAKHYTENGRFCVVFNFFKNTPNAFSALNWWTMKVLESTRRGNGVWGDQLYLNEFPNLFKEVGIVNDPNLIAAPWNISSKRIVLDSNNVLKIENQVLILFHFARLLVVNEKIFIPVKRTKLSPNILLLIYQPYIIDISHSISMIKFVCPKYKVKFTFKNLKAVFFSIILGRGFILFNNRIKRLGINIPIWYKKDKFL